MQSPADPPRPPPTRRADPAPSPLARLVLGALLAAGSGFAGAASTGTPIKIGMSAAFTGSSAGLGIEYYRGPRRTSTR